MKLIFTMSTNRSNFIGGLKIVAVSLFGMFIAFHIWDVYQNTYGTAKKYPVYEIQPKHDDTLRVLIIGDSWAYNHNALHCDSIFENIARNFTTKPVKCVSKGHNGQKTREVYMEMFTNRPMKYEWEKEFSTQHLLEEHPDYCVIMAGINDLAHQVSPSVYTTNYKYILEFLLENNICPVVMEIPEFNVVKACRIHGMWKFGLYRLISFVTGSGWDNVRAYRGKMIEMLKSNNLGCRVLFIPASSWNPKGYTEFPKLYLNDELHLSRYGYRILDSCLVYEIFKFETDRIFK